MTRAGSSIKERSSNKCFNYLVQNIISIAHEYILPVRCLNLMETSETLVISSLQSKIVWLIVIFAYSYWLAQLELTFNKILRVMVFIPKSSI